MRSAHATYLTNAAKARIMAANGACAQEARTALKRVARARIAAARAARELADA